MDVLIENHGGSLALFTPMTPAAHQWVEGNVDVEPWQRMGASIACEPRYLDNIIQGMQDDGLVVWWLHPVLGQLEGSENLN